MSKAAVFFDTKKDYRNSPTVLGVFKLVIYNVHQLTNLCDYFSSRLNPGMTNPNPASIATNAVVNETSSPV